MVRTATSFKVEALSISRSRRPHRFFSGGSALQLFSPSGTLSLQSGQITEWIPSAVGDARPGPVATNHLKSLCALSRSCLARLGPVFHMFLPPCVWTRTTQDASRPPPPRSKNPRSTLTARIDPTLNDLWALASDKFRTLDPPKSQIRQRHKQTIQLQTNTRAPSHLHTLPLLKLPNSTRRTDIDRVSFQNGLTVVFLWCEFVCLWFSLSLAVVTPWWLAFACSVWHWNVKFPPGSQVWRPKEPCQSGMQKPVPSHLPHHKK